MKRWLLLCVSAWLMLPTLADARPHKIDYKASSLTFEVSTLYPVKGSFSQFRTTLDFNEKQPEKSTVSAVILADSIKTGIARRDAHLKEADFFNVDAYRRITFTSTSVKKDKPNKLTIEGKLTIRGISAKVQLSAVVGALQTDEKGKKYRTFTATTRINRHDFEVSHSYETVGPYVTISIQLKAYPQ